MYIEKYYYDTQTLYNAQIKYVKQTHRHINTQIESSDTKKLDENHDHNVTMHTLNASNKHRHINTQIE